MTYAGAYGRNERLPVDRVLRREGHPLGVRRAEATKAATEEHENVSTNHKRWALGAAAGALLVAGTFVASSLGLSGGATETAGAAPEHAPAAPGHTPGNGPVVGAPAPRQEDQHQPQNQPVQPTETTPQGSTDPRTGVPADTGTGTPQAGGDNQRTTTPGTTTPTTPPADTTTPTTPPADTTTPPAEEEDQGGGLGDVVGGVLDPVTDVVGGILSPSTTSSSDTSTTTTKAAPSGPALAMIDPLGGLFAG